MPQDSPLHNKITASETGDRDRNYNNSKTLNNFKTKIEKLLKSGQLLVDLPATYKIQKDDSSGYNHFYTGILINCI